MITKRCAGLHRFLGSGSSSQHELPLPAGGIAEAFGHALASVGPLRRPGNAEPAASEQRDPGPHRPLSQSAAALLQAAVVCEEPHQAKRSDQVDASVSLPRITPDRHKVVPEVDQQHRRPVRVEGCA